MAANPVPPAPIAAPPPPIGFHLLPLKMIVPSPLNPRKRFDEGKLRELAASMGGGVGIIEPLIVRPCGPKGPLKPTDVGRIPPVGYELVAGERRWRAAAIADLPEAPVVIKALTDVQVLELMVIENNQREDINALEEADGYRKMTTLGVPIDTLAARLGRSRKYVYDRIKLFDLVPAAQSLLLADHITAGHAILLARLTPAQQQAAVDLESPLFVHEQSSLTPAEQTAQQQATKTDPYAGLKVRSVRELDAWISDHCRFDPKTPVNRELFPDTARAVEAAVKVVQITRDTYTQPDAKEGNTQRIYHGSSWKRADGAPDYETYYGAGRPKASKVCERSALGVVVAGPGRGEAFQVCVDKDCDVHWKAERLARAKAAKQTTSAKSSAARQQAADTRWEAQQKKERAAREAWQQAVPQIHAALEPKIATAAVLVVASIVGDAYDSEANDWRSEAIKRLGTPKTAEAWLRVFALCVVLSLADDSWTGPRRLPAIAKALGVDLAKVLKKAAVQTSAPATTKAAKKR
jgi:ParB family chromosome partitioning protein